MKKREFKEFLKENESGIKTLDELKNYVGDKVECVAFCVNYKDHGYYETAIDVYKLEDGLVGVRLLSRAVVLPSLWDEIDSAMGIYDMKEVKTITYEIDEHNDN